MSALVCYLGRICVNEDFYDLLAQVITFHIILKSVIFEKKTKREIATWKFFQARPVLSLREHSQIRELNYRLEEIQTGMV